MLYALSPLDPTFFQATNLKAERVLSGHNSYRLAVTLKLSDTDCKVSMAGFLKRLSATVTALRRHGNGNRRRYTIKQTQKKMCCYIKREISDTVFHGLSQTLFMCEQTSLPVRNQIVHISNQSFTNEEYNESSFAATEAPIRLYIEQFSSVSTDIDHRLNKAKTLYDHERY